VLAKLLGIFTADLWKIDSQIQPLLNRPSQHAAAGAVKASAPRIRWIDVHDEALSMLVPPPQIAVVVIVEFRSQTRA
jgi:hypothetical protein